ncbi:cation diffusion facilitator family transporter [Notoacmeibacter ruber]|uniref:Cation-efflux pump FieF n=1 Tax=Notoacmeibacter ruber TaxID=2670375 RepID=A0A3L7JCH9_9HYPH|nr:cation diffusion facilitator family transporter [Notoacmeibacter ruber]RLQ88366.1 cation transporter [Notoacmeibacter ruber]
MVVGVFQRNRPDGQKRPSDARTVRRLAVLSVVMAFVVMGLKFLAWQLTGSVALFSDALESIVNVVAAFAALMAISIAQRPPDEDHPFGHHKAEYFSAVLEGVLIAVAALLIAVEAIPMFLRPVPVENSSLGIGVNLVATAVNGGLAILLLRKGRALRSPALQADGQHILTDVWTSLGVVLALVLVALTGWLWIDPLVAILVAANILYHGAKVIVSSLNGLMDRAVEPDEQALIEECIRENAMGAIEVHDIRSRVAGPVRFIEFHLVVDRAMSVGAAHEICDRIEGAIRRAMKGARVTIHVEPEEKSEPHGLPIT